VLLLSRSGMTTFSPWFIAGGERAIVDVFFVKR